MEWVETTGKTVEEAKEAALDELGVDAEEAEFEVVEAPRPGLFGRMRGEARVRTRVRPAEVRPKNDRRRRPERAGRSRKGSGTPDSEREPAATGASVSKDAAPAAPAAAAPAAPSASEPAPSAEPASDVAPDEVGAAAVDFVEGLVKAFGLNGSVELHSDGVELDVSVQGDELGVLIGPGGKTLVSVQNLARVAAQRRLGDHETRLRVDVAGYRERRKTALEAFVRRIADEVRDTGTPRLLEPMTSADRKIVHDVINETDGVVTRSEGDDPQRRVVVAPGP